MPGPSYLLSRFFGLERKGPSKSGWSVPTFGNVETSLYRIGIEELFDSLFIQENSKSSTRSESRLLISLESSLPATRPFPTNADLFFHRLGRSRVGLYCRVWRPRTRRLGPAIAPTAAGGRSRGTRNRTDPSRVGLRCSDSR